MCSMYFWQEATETSSASVDDQAEPFRAAVDRSVQGYVKDHYPNGIVTVSYVMLYVSLIIHTWAVDKRHAKYTTLMT